MDTFAPKSPTPILDLELALPQTRRWDRLTWRQAILIVVLPLLAIFVLVPACLIIRDNNPAVSRLFSYIETNFDPFFTGPSAPNPVLLFCAFFLSIFLIVVIHELGHVAAGFGVGLRFEAIRIGPLMLTKSVYGLKISLQRVSNLDGIAAMGIQQLRKLRQKLAIYIAGGPAANALSALCVWLFLSSQFSGALPYALPQFLRFFAGFSILTAGLNLIPFRGRNGMFTDGARLLSLARSKAKTRRWFCILALKMQSSSGVRLKNLKRTWIAHSCAVSDQSLDALFALWIAYLAANDRNDAEQAAQFLERCLERFAIAPAAFQKLLLMEAAIFQAWFRDDEHKATTWARKSEEAAAAAPPLNQIRMAICISWGGNRYDELASAWEKGRIYIETLPPSPAKDLLANAWSEWKGDIDRKRAAREAVQPVGIMAG
jgi:hypothetical protein